MYTEGMARIRYQGGAFLNPTARFSRDISVAFVESASSRGMKVLDATAATGIRGIRYYLEAKAHDLSLLEMNKNAFSPLIKNLRYNNVRAEARNASIQEFANTSSEKFDIIDLDPFGGISPYIYDLMKISRDGGYLMATATDTAVLCGAHRKACLRLYDALPMHNELCHEVGMRIMIGYIARVAAQFNFGIEPMLSVSHLHYMRVFLKLAAGTKNANDSIGMLGYAYYCAKCGNRYCKSVRVPENQCKLCSGRLDASGKLWTGPLHDGKIASAVKGRMMKSSAGSEGLRLIEVMEKESDIPLYYSVPHLTKRLGIGSVSPAALMGALKEKGFIASETHMRGSSIKTDANIIDMKAAAKAIYDKVR